MEDEGRGSCLSDEQRARMERQRQMAIARQKGRQKLSNANSNNGGDGNGSRLSQQQMGVLKAIARGESVFVTGSAGTGKSYLLNFAVRILKRIHPPDSVFVTASTGLAACALNGTTLHSFSGVGLGEGSKEFLLAKVSGSRQCVKRWRKARALIIDEISMIDGELFDNLNYIASTLRRSSKPFGGLQLVVTGDFFQLPPVKPQNPLKYFAFEAECWNQCFDKQIELTNVFRQSDSDFVRILQQIRRGERNLDGIALLKECSHGPLESDIALTRLYPRKLDVGKENEQKLRVLGNPIVTFHAKDDGASRLTLLLENGRAPKQVGLCLGAQVMLIKNISTEEGLVNGARGVIVEFVGMPQDADKRFSDSILGSVSPTGVWPKVKFVSGVVKVVGPESWSITEGDRELAKRTQVPLILAWALSVHKCQGMTLDRVETDLSEAFEYGMVYVALSRVKNLQGLRLSGFDPCKIKVHPKVVNFYQRLTEGSLGMVTVSDSTSEIAGT
eukprot:Gb_41691 [translate_table: standard]